MYDFVGYTADNGRVYISIILLSQSQSQNSSAIQWLFGWEFLGAPTDRELDNGYCVVDGAARYNVPGRVADYPLGRSGTGRYQVASGSFTVFHDANGYRTVAVDGHLVGYSGAYSALSSVGIATLPRIPKPPSAPGAPSLSLQAGSGPSSRTVNASWSAPSDNGGSSITGYNLQVATDSGFTANVSTYALTSASMSITLPAYSTAYYFRAQAKNSIGTGPFGSSANITTGADVPAAPTIGAMSAVGPVSAAVSWSAPSTNNGSALTGYDVQWAADSGFTTGVVTQAVGTSASPYTLTGLNPATTYYVRVRAKNSIGASAWSGSLSFLTLPSVHVPNAGLTAWVDAIVYIESGGAWVPVQIKTPSTDGTAWV
jgi:hypothetical protein